MPPYLKQEFKQLSPRNLVNADTLTLNFNDIGDGVKSVTASVVKVSGTVAGKVYIYATPDYVQWDKVDSITLSDVTIVQSKTVTPSTGKYIAWKGYFLTAGTQSYTPYFSYVRRPAEK